MESNKTRSHRGYFEALDRTDLFDVFVQVSMEKKLVSQYEQIDGGSNDVTTIRAKLSELLCQAGFREIQHLEKELGRGQRQRAQAAAFTATNLFEPAIAFSEDQIAAFLGMAMVYKSIGAQPKSQEFARRGLSRLEELKRSCAAQAMRQSTVLPSDMLDQAERQLRMYA